MEQYKLINAELMDQVQKQRITIGEMRKAEVLLKRQLLEEREMRLADAQYNENKLKCALRTFMNSLDVNLDGNGDYPTTRTSAASDNVRHSHYSSSQACSVLRRSSALLQRSLAVSPTRRSRSLSSCSVTSHEEMKESSPVKERLVIVRKTPEPRHLVELQGNMDSPDCQEAGPSPDQLLVSPTPVADMYSIIEESDSEDNTLSSSLKLHEPQKLRASSSSMELSPLPLRDLTNKTDSVIPNLKITKSHCVAASTQDETENTMKDPSIEHGKCDFQQSYLAASQRITAAHCRSSRVHKIDTKSDSLEPSIEHVRLAAQTSSSMHVIIQCPSPNAGPALTPRRSQLNFSNFNGIANRPGDSSTPRREQETLTTNWKSASKTEKPKRTNSANSLADQSRTDCSMSSRPSRSCRPKSLKEPKLNSKMRNETLTK
ncbi:shugoshin-like isoform X1 [Drosophila novamexicana]|uniref:shugoshin-like isoform X1 n=1 Tax=Drosophila novamexicana TaxID=47314 RepID=UPI0011E5AE70|nr:shugoshin-like isoform X1 [Drosophila novamexicana]